MRYAMRCWWLGVTMGLAALPLAAAERCRAIDVEAGEKIADHELVLTLVHNGVEVATGGAAPPALAVGDEVDLCFQSSRAGLVSLWSHDSPTAPPVRILPHEYLDATADTLGVPVEAGVRRCFSELAAGQDVVLRVRPPLGEAEVYLHYAEDADGQFGPEDFPSIGNRAATPPPECGDAARPGTHSEPYASHALRYEVVE